MNMNMEEQRDYPRFPLDVEARIINMEGTACNLGRTQDISKVGVSVHSDGPVALDAVYTLLFAVPHDGGRNEVYALMDPLYSVPDEEGGYQTGFAFRHVGVNHAALILSYITRRQYPQEAVQHGRGRAVPSYLRGMSPVARLHTWRASCHED
ncbi:MAG: PilZ domain-containing protein [Rhodocyclaceae bacterium]|nr:PilZ domain-containing protein [Rhodocyclaceae bacterium]MCL4682208.1 PilZ domain-containing protein [Rhodocyclaceae bacterium]